MNAKRYILFILFMAIASLIMGTKDLGLLILMVTFGITLPLVFAPTFLGYGLCFAPTVFGWKNNTYRLPGIILSLMLCFALAIVPNTLGSQKLTPVVASIINTNTRPTTLLDPVKIKGMEIHLNGLDPYDLVDRPFLEGVCDQTCQTLLMGQQVDWVRVIEEKPARKNKKLISTYFQLGKRNECKNLKAVTPGCIEKGEDVNKPANLVVTIKRSGTRDGDYRNFESNSQFVNMGKQFTLTIAILEHGKIRHIYKQTEIRANIAVKPSIAMTALDESDKRFGLLHHEKIYNAINLQQAYQAIGFDLTNVPAVQNAPKPSGIFEPPTQTETDSVISVLHTPRSTPLSENQKRIIGKWLNNARWHETLPAKDIPTLRKIINDPRSESFHDVTTILKKSPQAAKALIPDILTMLETHGYVHKYAYADAANSFIHIPPDVLRPYAARILKLIRQNDANKAALYKIIGRLGINPNLHIRQAMKNKNRNVQSAALYGACMAEDKWSPELLSVLRPMLTPNFLTKGDRWKVKAVIKATYRHGDPITAIQALEQTGWQDIKRQKKRLLNTGKSQTLAGRCHWS